MAESPSQGAPLASALAEADAKSLDELFSRDPQDLPVGSKGLEVIISELRRYCALWQQEEAAGKTRSSGPKAPKVAKPNVSLGDLGL